MEIIDGNLPNLSIAVGALGALAQTHRLAVFRELVQAGGEGVAAGGQAALSSALASCAPGVAAVNIDNGFGAACMALKILNAGGA